MKKILNDIKSIFVYYIFFYILWSLFYHSLMISVHFRLFT